MCLSDRCTEDHEAHANFDAWFGHARRSDQWWHRKAYLTSSWVCAICDLGSDTYLSPEALNAHLSESHSGDFTDDQIQAIAKQSRIEKVRSKDECLLCGFAVDSDGKGQSSVSSDKRQKSQGGRNAKQARQSYDIASPAADFSDSDMTDSSSSSVQQAPSTDDANLSKAVSRHIAVHLENVMLLALRFATLKKDEKKFEDEAFMEDLDSNIADVNELEDLDADNDLGRLSDFEAQDDNMSANSEDHTQRESSISIDDIEIPETEDDYFDNVPRQQDNFMSPEDLMDYTIAWICTSPAGVAAAEAMLDAKDPYLPLVKDDANNYILGRLGVQKVAIAFLKTRWGTSSNVSEIAEPMHRSFPSLRLQLVVGTGGGVPCKFDVRLGDVVVGESVIEPDHDSISISPEDDLESMATSSAPSAEFLSIIDALKVPDEKARTSPIQRMLNGAISRYPATAMLVDKSKLRDDLYHVDHEHVFGGTCNNCDPSQLVKRPERQKGEESKIHGGTIICGHTTYRKPGLRNSLGYKYNVLCVDSTTAHIGFKFPRLVVRGIADYADSHKNPSWDNYANFSAAAFARLFLLRLSAPTIASSPVSVPEGLLEPLPTETVQQIMRSLRCDGLNNRYHNIKPAVEGTCDWILETEEYAKWVEHPEDAEAVFLSQIFFPFLFIEGRSGDGKSTMMKFIVDECRLNSKHHVISFFFHADGDPRELWSIYLYRSLLQQLLFRVPRLAALFNLLPEHCLSDHSWVESDESFLKDLFQQAVAELGEGQQLSCLVDETLLAKHDEILTFFFHLRERAALKGVSLRFCFSCQYGAVTNRPGRLTLALGEGNGAGIANYINRQLRIPIRNADDQWAIAGELRSMAAGSFLWIRLAVNLLNEQRMLSTLVDVGAKLRILPLDLKGLLGSILRPDDEYNDITAHAIPWVLFTPQPLSVVELYTAIHYSRGVQVNAPEAMHEGEYRAFILSSTRGLAEFTTTEPVTVQFIHGVVRDYLLSDRGYYQRYIAAHLTLLGSQYEALKTICFNYIQDFHRAMVLEGLLFSNMVSEYLLKGPDPLALEQMRHSASLRYPLLEYAWKFMFWYSSNAETRAVDQTTFLRDFPTQKWIRIHNLFQENPDSWYSTEQSLLSILTEENMHHLIRVCDSTGINDPIGKDKLTPMTYAVQRGSYSTLEALLEKNAASDQTLCDTLYFVAYHGLQGSMNVLLTHQSSLKHINAVVRPRKTLLAVAAERGNQTIVNLLLKYGAETEPPDPKCFRPLCLAASEGHEPVVRELLGNLASVDDCSENSVTALSYAALHGHIEIVGILLDNGATSNYPDILGRTAMYYATHASVINLKLLKDADLGHRDNKGETLLHYTARYGNSDATEFFSHLNSTLVGNVDLENHLGQTPLSVAAEHGHYNIASILLSKAAEVNSRDHRGKTPFFHAVAGSQFHIMPFLQEHGADINAANKYGQTPLHYAVDEWNRNVVNQLLILGVRLDLLDKDGRTPLDYAKMIGFTAAELLIDGWLYDMKPDEISVSHPGGQSQDETNRQHIMSVNEDEDMVTVKQTHQLSLEEEEKVCNRQLASHLKAMASPWDGIQRRQGRSQIQTMEEEEEFAQKRNDAPWKTFTGGF